MATLALAPLGAYFTDGTVLYYVVGNSDEDVYLEDSRSCGIRHMSIEQFEAMGLRRVYADCDR